MSADLIPALAAELQDLRGLTLRQPWNWAILHAGKPVENRPMRAPRAQAGKWFALHAGAVYDEKGAAWIRTTFGLVVPGPAEVPLSCITALAKLGDCYRAGDLTKPKTPWAFGPWCYEIADRFLLPDPVPHGGMNGWWRVGEGARVAIGQAWGASGRAA